MPELPEVETVRMQLLLSLVGKTIAEVEVFHQKTVAYNARFAEELCNKTIAGISRVGKLLIFSFQDEDDFYVLVHLKMTGQFFYVRDHEEVVGGGHSLDDRSLLEGTWPHRHTRVALSFTDGGVLYFNDMRLFGYMMSVNKAARDQKMATFGPEPHQRIFDDVAWVARVHKRTTTIKAALLDQSLVAGLGNIYVDEALWYARIAPTRRANTLTTTELISIRTSAAKVLTRAIRAGGTTFQNFKDTQGKTGSYLKQLNVFARQGVPCRRCGSRIEKTKVAGRGTHWCPSCQK